MPDRRVLRSWERCRSRGLDCLGDSVGVVSANVLREARDRNGFLLSHARGILNHLYEQIRSTGSVVILSDSVGMILESLGDPDFVAQANRAELQPGASWDETGRGTNAIGTSLSERVPIEIVGSEHFLDRNGFLTCSASPIFDAHERLMGVLDISGDYRAYQRHTLGLVRMTTNILERRLFEAEFAREILLSFHTDMEYLGTLQEGLVVLSPGGDLVAANRPGLQMLGISRAHLSQMDFSMVFDSGFSQFVDRAGRDPQAMIALGLRSGKRIFARLRLPPVVVKTGAQNTPTLGLGAPGEMPRSPRSGPRDKCGVENATLSCLDTGDERLSAAIQRAGRIVGKDIPLLILGESGVGKEMFAKAFHRSGPRRSAPFVALNCAAIPENLIESELFGYVGGAFTGARREGYAGKIQQASGGTLFLDEIGDMPLNLQARLLRVLQERLVTPLGGVKSVPVDISLVCATHRNLPEAVRGGVFRQDLYYRVNGLTVTLPSLRERSDIRQIAETILAFESQESRPVALSGEVVGFFERYRWPGNIRQMHNAIRVAMALLDDGESVITPAHLPEELFAIESDHEEQAAQSKGGMSPRPSAGAVPATLVPADSLDVIERRAIEQVLQEEKGNVSAAARRLGISRNTLYRKMGRL
ncbi:MAG: sigma-54-dependent Fis family transcriptional regulator [Zoogloeaceae bacterium]|nr:sigma-54-dependent Fis family transcriptional regulator [Zoogloeaceae bacterium]